jgi:hypothetical protein
MRMYPSRALYFLAIIKVVSKIKQGGKNRKDMQLRAKEN